MTHRNNKKHGKSRRRSSIYATKTQMMSKQLSEKRYGNVSTKTFYFKRAGIWNTNNTGTVNENVKTLAEFPGEPRGLPHVGDIVTVSKLYMQYKILAIKLRLFAANVGVESSQGEPLPSSRGNTVIYIDQDIRPNEQAANDIIDVINLGSAKMIPSRIEKWSTTIYRPKGKPEWGTCDVNVPATDRVADPWYGSIQVLTNNASNQTRPLWFFTATYKVIFRGRNMVAED